MRRTFIGLVVAVSLAGAAISAQDARDTSPAPGSATGPSAPGGTATTRRDDDGGFDMGWLGLIGLAGLAGLMPKERKDRDTVATTTTNR